MIQMSGKNVLMWIFKFLYNLSWRKSSLNIFSSDSRSKAQQEETSSSSFIQWPVSSIPFEMIKNTEDNISISGWLFIHHFISDFQLQFTPFLPPPSPPLPRTVTGYLDTHPSIMEAIKTKARRFPLWNYSRMSDGRTFFNPIPGNKITASNYLTAKWKFCRYSLTRFLSDQNIDLIWSKDLFSMCQSQSNKNSLQKG